MPPELLLFIFSTHTPLFAWRWARTRELRYAATTLTFSLLTVAYGIRVFAPEESISGVSLFAIFRVPALAAAAVSIGLLIRRHARRFRRSTPG